LIIFVAVYADFHANIYSSVDQQLQNQRTVIDDGLPNVSWSPYLLMLSNSPLFGEVTRGVVTNAKGTVQESTDCSFGFISTCPQGSLDPTSGDGIRAALKTSTDLRTGHFKGQSERILSWTVLAPTPPPQVTGVIQISENATGEAACFSPDGLWCRFDKPSAANDSSQPTPRTSFGRPWH
jgi:hypothetical protein